jgi:Family of unknown function (DUF6178)
VLETPQLPQQIQALPGPVLGKLIERVGLEDAGELVALASTEQLAQIFDEELWHNAEPGVDERFDAERFLLWLEVMLEAGERFVAERLAELPLELVTLAFHRHVLVTSFDDLRAELTAGDDDAELAEKAFESCLSEEIEDYQLIWRGGDGWDTVLSALLALDRDHHSHAIELLERCANMSREYIADNGCLYDVLTSEEMLEGDLSAERETRRAERGYVAPSAAAAFLRLARQPVAKAAGAHAERDPLTRAYFRELSPAPVVSPERAGAPPRARELAQLLEASGIIQDDAAPRLLSAGPHHEEPLVIEALRLLASESPEKFAERREELAYLSNVLVAGCSVESRRLRPLEAVEHVLAAVSLGLWLAAGPKHDSPEDRARELSRQPCDVLFRLALGQAPEPKLRVSHKTAAKSLAQVRALLKTMKE